MLTGCLPEPPRPSIGYNYTFTHPKLAENSNYALSSLYYTTESDGKVAAHLLTPQSARGNQSRLWLSDFKLDKLANDPKCTTLFVQGEGSGRQDVKVSPNTVKTCNIYFVIHRSPNVYSPGWVPSESDVIYQTHSILSYASENFIYSMRNAAGNSLETGTRRQGWSLVRHEVLQPESTPGQFLVTMNSVPKEEEALPIRLHEETNFFTSMSLNGGQR